MLHNCITMHYIYFGFKQMLTREKIVTSRRRVHKVRASLNQDFGNSENIFDQQKCYKVCNITLIPKLLENKKMVFVHLVDVLLLLLFLEKAKARKNLHDIYSLFKTTKFSCLKYVMGV